MGLGGKFPVLTHTQDNQIMANFERYELYSDSRLGIKQTWQRQTRDFGHSEADKYTCLVFDNRGMGESDKPILRYTTSEMAKDVVELLNHVGWQDSRSIHVVGISMGGMIAQELVRGPAFKATITEQLTLVRLFKSQRGYAA